MANCSLCGDTLHFVQIDGRATPIHGSGGCSGRGITESHRIRAPESECWRTQCPVCGDPVVFVRHNGGSVYLEPPLGKPWVRHPCMEAETGPNHTKLAKFDVSAALAKICQLPGAVIGVVVAADNDVGRRLTVLTIEVAQSTPLELLVRGRANFLLGRIVVLDPAGKLLHAIPEAGPAYTALAAITVPPELDDEVMRALRDAAVAAMDEIAFPSWRNRNSAPFENHRLIEKYKRQWFGGSWSLGDRIALVPLVENGNLANAIHTAACLCMGEAAATGKTSSIVRLFRVVPSTLKQGLADWFGRYSPIVVSLNRETPHVRVSESLGDGNSIYRLDAAGKDVLHLCGGPEDGGTTIS